jgi:hypothetical protein
VIGPSTSKTCAHGVSMNKACMTCISRGDDPRGDGFRPRLPSPFHVGQEVAARFEGSTGRGVVRKITTYTDREAFHIVVMSDGEYGFATQYLTPWPSNATRHPTEKCTKCCELLTWEPGRLIWHCMTWGCDGVIWRGPAPRTNAEHPWGPGCAHDPECATELEHSLVTEPHTNEAKRPHLVDGEFQSDKYPTTPRGKVPLSVKDPTAQDLLWEYAQRRRTVDAEFSEDLETALHNAGYTPRSNAARHDPGCDALERSPSLGPSTKPCNCSLFEAWCEEVNAQRALVGNPPLSRDALRTYVQRTHPHVALKSEPTGRESRPEILEVPRMGNRAQQDDDEHGSQGGARSNEPRTVDPLDELAEIIDKAGAVMYFHDRDCAMWRKPPGTCDKECGRRAYARRDAQRTPEASPEDWVKAFLDRRLDPQTPLRGLCEDIAITAYRAGRGSCSDKPTPPNVASDDEIARRMLTALKHYPDMSMEDLPARDVRAMVEAIGDIRRSERHRGLKEQPRAETATVEPMATNQIVKVGGKTFRCEACNSNVFTRETDVRLTCNGCGARYKGGST